MAAQLFTAIFCAAVIAFTAASYVYETEITLSDDLKTFRGSVIIAPSSSSLASLREVVRRESLQAVETTEHVRSIEDGKGMKTKDKKRDSLNESIGQAFTKRVSFTDSIMRTESGHSIMSEPSEDSNETLQDADVHFAGGNTMRFTLGPVLRVQSVEVLVAESRTTTTPIDSPEVQHVPSPTHANVSPKQRFKKIGNAVRAAIQFERILSHRIWRAVPASWRNVLRGVYEIRLDSEAPINPLSTALHIVYEGPIFQIFDEMTATDIQRILWRGGIWRCGDIVGATSAGIGGRLGHLARIMPVMRVPRPTTTELDAEGAEASVFRFVTIVTHNQGLRMHTAPGEQSSEDLPLSLFSRIPKTRSRAVVGDTVAIPFTNAGWLLLANDAPLADLSSEHMNVSVHDLASEFSDVPNIELSNMDHSSHAHSSTLSHEAWTVASQTVRLLYKDNLPLRFITNARLAPALRDVMPEGIVALADGEIATVARATALSALIWHVSGVRKRRVMPWVVESLAEYYAGRVCSAVKTTAKEHVLESFAANELPIDSVIIMNPDFVSFGDAILRMITNVYGPESLDHAVFVATTPLTSIELARAIDCNQDKERTNPYHTDMSAMAFLQPWATNASLPVLRVDFVDGTLVLEQFPFLPSKDQSRWTIPVTIRSSNHEVVYSGIIINRTVISTEPAQRLLPINSDRSDGPYRVHYTRAAISAGLFEFKRSEGLVLALDDAFALVRYSRIPLVDWMALVFNVISSLPPNIADTDSTASSGVQRDSEASADLHRDSTIGAGLHRDSTIGAGLHRDSTIGFSLHRDSTISSGVLRDSTIGAALRRDSIASGGLCRDSSTAASIHGGHTAHVKGRHDSISSVSGLSDTISTGAYVKSVNNADVIMRFRQGMNDFYNAVKHEVERSDNVLTEFVLNVLETHTLANMSVYSRHSRLDRDSDDEIYSTSQDSTFVAEDPLKLNTQEIYEWLVHPDHGAINQLIFDMRLQAGDPAAVTVADTIFGMNKKDVPSTLQDILDRAALIYGDSAECLSIRNRKHVRPKKAHASVLNTYIRDPMKAFIHCMYAFSIILAYIAGFTASRFDCYLWITLKNISKHLPWLGPIWRFYDTTVNDFLSRNGYDVGCTITYEPGALPLIAVAIFRYILFVWTGLQSMLIKKVQDRAVMAVREFSLTQKTHVPWVTRIASRTNPAFWTNGQVRFKRSTGERVAYTPHDLSHDRIAAHQTSAAELNALDNDWHEAVYVRPHNIEPIDTRDFPDGVQFDLDSNN